MVIPVAVLHVSGWERCCCFAIFHPHCATLQPHKCSHTQTSHVKCVQPVQHTLYRIYKLDRYCIQCICTFHLYVLHIFVRRLLLDCSDHSLVKPPSELYPAIHVHTVKECDLDLCTVHATCPCTVHVTCPCPCTVHMM